MNLLQNFHIAVIEYLYRGRRAVPLQTYTTVLLDSNCKLCSYGFVNHYYANALFLYVIVQKSSNNTNFVHL